MRGTPTMSTWDNLRLTLAEASRYAPSDPDHIWRANTAWRFAEMIAACTGECRTAEEIMVQAMMSIQQKEAA